MVGTIDTLTQGVDDVMLVSLAVEGEDEETFNEAIAEPNSWKPSWWILSSAACSPVSTTAPTAISISSPAPVVRNAGYSHVVLRMYLRWGDAHGYKPELIECSDGDVAGIKSATVKFSGEYAFGWLRTETGVHRLVRKSPFNSGGRRHTCFCPCLSIPKLTTISTSDRSGGSAYRRLPRLRCRWSAR
ncbi:PCRF domain-containing protein [Escherichia coli]